MPLSNKSALTRLKWIVETCNLFGRLIPSSPFLYFSFAPHSMDVRRKKIAEVGIPTFLQVDTFIWRWAKMQIRVACVWSRHGRN